MECPYLSMVAIASLFFLIDLTSCIRFCCFRTNLSMAENGSFYNVCFILYWTSVNLFVYSLAILWKRPRFEIPASRWGRKLQLTTLTLFWWPWPSNLIFSDLSDLFSDLVPDSDIDLGDLDLWPSNLTFDLDPGDLDLWPSIRTVDWKTRF